MRAARRDFEWLLERSRDSWKLYLSHLMLGAMDEDARRHAEAIAHYRAAAGIEPSSPTARFALSHALLGRQDVAGAIATARAAFDRGGEAVAPTDGWVRLRDEGDVRYRMLGPGASRRGRALISVAFTLLLLAEPQAPAFPAQVEVVRLDVAVTRESRPVSGLGPANFEVREDGASRRSESARWARSRSRSSSRSTRAGASRAAGSSGSRPRRARCSRSCAGTTASGS